MSRDVRFLPRGRLEMAEVATAVSDECGGESVLPRLDTSYLE